MRIGIDTSYHQNLRAQCSAPRIAADDHYCSTSTLTKGDYARLGLVTLPSRWSATILLLAFRWTKSFQILFEIFDYSIQDPMTCYPSRSTHSFDIQTHFVAYHGISEAPEGVFTRDFLRRCRYIAVAQIQTKEAWHQYAACKGGWNRMGRGQWTI